MPIEAGAWITDKPTLAPQGLPARGPVGSYQVNGHQPTLGRREKGGHLGALIGTSPPARKQGRARVIPQTPQGCRTPAASSDTGRRPKSAPSCAGAGGKDGVLEQRRRPQSAAASGGGDMSRRRRPQSAPTLLRGEGPLSRRQAHEDEFLQRIETCEVKRKMDAWKREKHIMNDKGLGIDPLEDSSLYDLKVLHNVAERSKGIGASLGKRPDSACSEPGGAVANSKKSVDATASEEMHALCVELRRDLRKKCSRLSKLTIETNEVSASGKITLCTKTFQELVQFQETPEDAEYKQKRERQEFLSAGFGGLFGKTVAKPALGSLDEDEEDEEAGSPRAVELPPPTPSEPAPEPPTPVAATQREACERPGTAASRAAKQRLGELVGFLIGCCGSVREAFTMFDSNRDRVLSLQEWETGMAKLGFKDDVAYVFKLLGKGVGETAKMDEVQKLFDPFLKRAH